MTNNHATVHFRFIYPQTCIWCKHTHKSTVGIQFFTRLMIIFRIAVLFFALYLSMNMNMNINSLISFRLFVSGYSHHFLHSQSFAKNLIIKETLIIEHVILFCCWWHCCWFLHSIRVSIRYSFRSKWNPIKFNFDAWTNQPFRFQLRWVKKSL